MRPTGLLRALAGLSDAAQRRMIDRRKPAIRRIPVQWVNTALGNIKTALAGTHHHVSAKHAQRYLASFAWRLYGASGVKL